MTTERQKILTILFDNELSYQEVPLFRGAIIQAARTAINAESAHVLFHNHLGEGFRFSYPLIQYKRIYGKAAIVCIGDGTEVIGDFFSSSSPMVQLGDKTTMLRIARILAQPFLIKVWDSSFKYSIRRWMPLNSQNYSKYMEMDDLVGKIEFLQRILTGNILSMAKGLGVDLTDPITVKLTHLDSPFIVAVKSVKMMTFNAEFTTNVSLPQFIGLGKDASIGFGTLFRTESERHQQKQSENGPII